MKSVGEVENFTICPNRNRSIEQCGAWVVSRTVEIGDLQCQEYELLNQRVRGEYLGGQKPQHLKIYK